MATNNKLLYMSRIIFDIIILVFTFLFADYILASFALKRYDSITIFLIFTLVVVWFFASVNSGLYDEYRSRSVSFEIIALIKNIITITISSVFIEFVVEGVHFTRSFILIFVILLFVFVSIQKYCLRKILEVVRRNGNNVRKVLIVGAGELGKNFYDTIVQNPHFGYQLVGFVDDQNKDLEYGEFLGGIDELDETLNRIVAEDVIIALPNYAYDRIEQVIRICENHTTRVKIIPDYFRWTTKKFDINMFGKFALISLKKDRLSEWHWRIVKRLFDIVFSLSVIVFLFVWLFPILWIIQKITSSGPFLFVQDRVGRNNILFRCFKIRSMNVEQEKNSQMVVTIKNDNRVTKFGKILRKTNLDELPQFFNVLLGDMSVVGPRPHAVKFNEKYGMYVDEIKVRHLVKPGITGWAQVNGLRGDDPDENKNKIRTQERINHDIWYIENWSFFLDLEIIFLTIWRSIRGDKNAY